MLFNMWSANEIFDGRWPTDEIVYMNFITGKADLLLDVHWLVKQKLPKLLFFPQKVVRHYNLHNMIAEFMFSF